MKKTATKTQTPVPKETYKPERPADRVRSLKQRGLNSLQVARTLGMHLGVVNRLWVERAQAPRI